MIDDLLMALGLILALEGALYALFPNGMKKMMHIVMAQPTESLRMTGMATATVGVAIVWALKRFVVG